MVLTPEFKVIEFDVSSAVSGQWLGFVNTTSRVLDFQQVDNSSSGVNSATKVVAMSGVEFNGNSTVENMRFYLASFSAFGAGAYEFLMDITNTWTQNKVVTQANDNVPTSLPGSQNYFRHGGGTQITGSGQVDGLGQWLYLAVFIGTDVPNGTYGGLGDNSFRYRFRFDYF
jgi:hypothetical protein